MAGGIFHCSRRFLIALLLTSLAITSIRQTLDFIGRMWVPILINFAHILFLIFGIFGAWQFRPGFLILSSFWMPFFLSWNVFLGCFYLNFETLNREEPILSFGQTRSRSFWIERMPMCQYSYDISTAKWIPPERCLVPYYYAEVVMAIINFMVALLAFCFALVYMCTFSRKSIQAAQKRKRAQKTQSMVNGARTPSLQGTPTKQNGGVNLDPSGAPIGPEGHRRASYDSHTTGYLNTSFESDATASKQFQPQLDKSGNLVQHYNKKRMSSKRKKNKKGENKLVEEVTEEEIQFHENKNRSMRARSQSTGRNKNAQNSTRNNRARSVSPINSHRSDDSPPVPNSVFDSISHKLVYESPRQQAIAEQYSQGVVTPIRRDQHRGSKGNLSLQDYNSRRLSVTEPRGIRNSNDSILNGSPAKRSQRQLAISHNPFKGSKTNLQAQPEPPATLMGFDPKSNTLIRYQNQVEQFRQHLDDSTQSHEQANSSAESCGAQSKHSSNYQRIAVPPDPVPSSVPHNPTDISPPPSSQDSGHPQSASGWSNGGSVGELQNRSMIGYEPLRQAPIQRTEPIYSSRRQPPPYHTHYHAAQQKVINAYDTNNTPQQYKPTPKNYEISNTPQQYKPTPNNYEISSIPQQYKPTPNNYETSRTNYSSNYAAPVNVMNNQSTNYTPQTRISNYAVPPPQDRNYARTRIPPQHSNVTATQQHPMFNSGSLLV